VPVFLLIETSTEVCSVALSEGHEIIALRESIEANAHSRNTTVFVDEVLQEANVSINDVSAIVVSKGPGSYTGLRIGVSTAKGLCLAADKALIAVSSLEALAVKARLKYQDENTVFVPMIDARRMEVYMGIWSSIKDNAIIQNEDVSAKIIDEHSFNDISKDKNIILLGNGASKFVDVNFDNLNVKIDDKLTISATNMLNLAERAFENQNFEDVAYFTPFYLKDFIAGKPRVKGLE
jgi:tRNA threonylcarbamoyladenosine biosynthesis protein TsaB